MDQATTLCADYTDIYTEPAFELDTVVCGDGSSCDLQRNSNNHDHALTRAALAHIHPTPFLQPHHNKDIQRRWKHLDERTWKDGSSLQAHLVTHPTQAEHYIFVIGKARDVLRRTNLHSSERHKVEQATSHVMSSGFHVSSIAYKTIHRGKISSDDTHDLKFLAHIIMRPKMKKNISHIHEDFSRDTIQLKILSHDSLETCQSILRAAGVSCLDDSCETGERIQAMRDEELASIIPHTTLFADIEELDRQRIIRLLEQNGNRVITRYERNAR